jgi:Leucine-rich repeat (LRR) protein
LDIPGLEEALRRIDEAAACGATALRLDHIGLEDVPAEVAQLTNLTELYLAGNQLDRLPAEIGLLTELTWLDVSRNVLESLPPEIGELTGLTRLRLGKNRLTSIPPEIARLTALTWLDLSENLLSSLPPELFQLPDMNWLGLSTNRLADVPPEIGRLAALNWLSLSGNQLSALPPEVGWLTGLTEMHLSGNQLTSLPQEIGQLTGLTLLGLTDNKLTSLPSTIGRLTGLKELYVDDNPLTALPPELSRLDKLKLVRIDEQSGIVSPPQEVLARGTQAVLEYLDGVYKADEQIRSNGTHEDQEVEFLLDGHDPHESVCVDPAPVHENDQPDLSALVCEAPGDELLVPGPITEPDPTPVLEPVWSDTAEEQSAIDQFELLKQLKSERAQIESECPTAFVVRRKRPAAVIGKLFGQKVEMNLLCQNPGSWHATGKDGTYDVYDVGAWTEKIGPYLAVLVQELKTAPLAAWPTPSESSPGEIPSEFEDALKLMLKLVDSGPGRGKDVTDPLGTSPEIQQTVLASLRSLRDMLGATDPKHGWGALRKVQTSEGNHLWLCGQHAREFQG